MELNHNPLKESKPQIDVHNTMQAGFQNRLRHFLHIRPIQIISWLVLDCESSGLDPNNSELIQLACFKLNGADAQPKLLTNAFFKPSKKLPQTNINIHGLSNEFLKEFSPLSKSKINDLKWLETMPIVGHNIFFDVNLIDSNFQKLGANFSPLVAFDTAILAEYLYPNLLDNKLETICEHLDITIQYRHNAMGDALATAEVFGKMLKILDKRNVRNYKTLSKIHEKIKNQHNLTIEEYNPKQSSTFTLANDLSIYTKKVKEVMNKNPILIDETATIKEAIGILATKNISSLIVKSKQIPKKQANDKVKVYSINQVNNYRLLTEENIIKILCDNQDNATQVLNHKIENFTLPPLRVMPEDAFLYRTLGRFYRYNIKHLGAINRYNALTGIITRKNLIYLRSLQTIELGDEIDSAQDVLELSIAWNKLGVICQGLLQDGLDTIYIQQIVSREQGALTRRAVEIAYEKLLSLQWQDPEVRFSVLVMGSAGRGDSHFCSDQDNALIYHIPENKKPQKQQIEDFFAELSQHFVQILSQAGVPLCPGNIMASNSQWRGDIKSWQKKINLWLNNPNPQNILNSDIFFDARCVLGADNILGDLIRISQENVAEAVPYLKSLCSSLEEIISPPFNLWGNIINNAQGFDYKKHVIFPITSYARILTLRTNNPAISTLDRLKNIKNHPQISEDDTEKLIICYEIASRTMIKQQIKNLNQQQTISTYAKLPKKSSIEYKILKDGLNIIKNIPTIINDIDF